MNTTATVSGQGVKVWVDAVWPCLATRKTPLHTAHSSPASHNTLCHATTAGASTHTHVPAHRWSGVAERLLGPEEVGDVGLGKGSDERLVLLLGGHQ